MPSKLYILISAAPFTPVQLAQERRYIFVAHDTLNFVDPLFLDRRHRPEGAAPRRRQRRAVVVAQRPAFHRPVLDQKLDSASTLL